MTTEQIESALGYTFKDKQLLQRALTLPSADAKNNNQTLEFFGDAIIEFLVSEKIFDEEQSEGTLTEKRKNLVSDSALAPVSRELGLDKALIKSPYDKTNKKAVPSVYEAVVAAIYLDGGIDAARKFVLSTLNFASVSADENYKGKLQELLQSQGLSCPEYVTESCGTAQEPMHTSSVTVCGKEFNGTGVRARGAEQDAAKAAYEYLTQKDEF